MKEEKEVQYVLCPRCELNYMKSTEKYCDVCKAELGLGGIDIIPEDMEDDEKICPICHSNYLAEDEEICSACRKKKEEEEKANKEDELDNWDYKEDVGNDIEETDISWEGLGEEEEEEEEEENQDDFDKDFNNYDFQDVDLSDDDDDEDEEDEDDEEDEEDEK